MDLSRIGDIGAAEPAAGAGAAQGLGGRYPLEGRHVCPFCGTLNETMDGPCPQCTMSNTAETRKATKSRIGPWYVLQSRNPAAPGMRYETLLGFVRKGRVKGRSIVRGPTTHQLWRFACQVKGLSREFGLCYSCGGSIEHEAQLCPQCNRLQDPPADPDTFLEGQGTFAAAAAVPPPQPAAPATRPIAPAEAIQETPPEPIFKELRLSPLVELPSVGDDSPSSPPAASIDPAIPLGAPIPTVPPAVAVSARTSAAPASPPPPAGPRKRNANDVFLSAKDLAAAFQLEFGGKDDDEGRASRGDNLEADAPWSGAASAGAQVARPAHRRPRGTRRLGRLVLLLLVLGIGGAAAYLALNTAARGRVFAWAEAKYMALTGANLYPDLKQPRPGAGGDGPSLRAGTTTGAPGAERSAGPPGNVSLPVATATPSHTADVVTERPVASAATQAAVDRPPAPQTAGLAPGADSVVRSVPRPDPTVASQRNTRRPSPAPSTMEGPTPVPASAPAARAPVVKPPAASQPAAPVPKEKEAEAPRMTREESERKSRALYFQALDAEERGDWKKAKELYQEIMATLPRDVWYAGTETNLRVAKDALGEK